MHAGTVFRRTCAEGDDCCAFVMSYHNDVKHYTEMEFDEHQNAILCSIMKNINWVEKVT